MRWQTKEDELLIGQELIRLKNLIAESFSESEWLELGTLVNHFAYVKEHPRLLRSKRFGDDDYEGCVLTVLRTIVEADPENLEAIASYVRSKSPEDGDNVSSHNDEGRKIVFSPQVFKIPDSEVDTDLVAVMMPFAGFDRVYEAIKGAVADAGLECQRVDDIWDDSTVVASI